MNCTKKHIIRLHFCMIGCPPSLGCVSSPRRGAAWKKLALLFLWQTKLWLQEYSDTLGCQFRTFLKPAVKFASDSFLGKEGCSIKSHFLGIKSLQPIPLKATFCVKLNVWSSGTARRKREGSLFVLQNRKAVAFYTVNMH